MISRRTSPFAFAGSSTWSQIATLSPSLSSRARYPSSAWCGTPHIGASLSVPFWRAVRVSSSSSAARFASSKKSSKKSPMR